MHLSDSENVKLHTAGITTHKTYSTSNSLISTLHTDSCLYSLIEFSPSEPELQVSVSRWPNNNPQSVHWLIVSDYRRINPEKYSLKMVEIIGTNQKPDSSFWLRFMTFKLCTTTHSSRHLVHCTCTDEIMMLGEEVEYEPCDIWCSCVHVFYYTSSILATMTCFTFP